ncbi:hypothetical protein CF319_g9041 [Tilletia indica]|nr:hypothetical protein CF319_g9041 [Tilletia indica]
MVMRADSLSLPTDGHWGPVALDSRAATSIPSSPTRAMRMPPSRSVSSFSSSASSTISSPSTLSPSLPPESTSAIPNPSSFTTSDPRILPIVTFTPIDPPSRSSTSFHPLFQVSHVLTASEFVWPSPSSASVEVRLVRDRFYITGLRSGLGVTHNGESLFSRSRLRRPMRLVDGDIIGFVTSLKSSPIILKLRVRLDAISLTAEEELVTNSSIPSRIDCVDPVPCYSSHLSSPASIAPVEQHASATSNLSGPSAISLSSSSAAPFPSLRHDGTSIVPFPPSPVRPKEKMVTTGCAFAADAGATSAVQGALVASAVADGMQSCDATGTSVLTSVLGTSAMSANHTFKRELGAAFDGSIRSASLALDRVRTAIHASIASRLSESLSSRWLRPHISPAFDATSFTRIGTISAHTARVGFPSATEAHDPDGRRFSTQGAPHAADTAGLDTAYAALDRARAAWLCAQLNLLSDTASSQPSTITALDSCALDRTDRYGPGPTVDVSHSPVCTGVWDRVAGSAVLVNKFPSSLGRLRAPQRTASVARLFNTMLVTLRTVLHQPCDIETASTRCTTSISSSQSPSSARC